MNEPNASSPAPGTVTPPPTPAKETASGFKLFRVLMVAAVLVIAAVGYWFIENDSAQGSIQKLDLVASIKAIQQRTLSNKATQLAANFTDANNDLIADTPANPIDPAVLVFSPIPSNDETIIAAWKDFATQLEKALPGKKVELKMYPSMSELPRQLEAFTKGEIHLASFNTGSVPTAVNTAGFVPFCCPGAADGSYLYEMEIIVPAGTLSSVDQLRGRIIAFTDFRSLSGFKAPLLLMRDKGMLPGRDYDFVISGDHERSIRGVADKKYQAAAVANDLLKRELAKGTIKSEQYSSIFKSDKLPPNAFGYTYQLKPELAQKIKDGFLKFNWSGSPLEKIYQPSNQAKFVSVDYKKDWEYVRSIDAAMVKWGDK